MSALRASRADALLQLIDLRGGQLVIDDNEYRALAYDGYSRAAVDRAIDDLAEDGAVEVVAGRGPLVVRLISAKVAR